MQLSRVQQGGKVETSVAGSVGDLTLTSSLLRGFYESIVGHTVGNLVLFPDAVRPLLYRTSGESMSLDAFIPIQLEHIKTDFARIIASVLTTSLNPRGPMFGRMRWGDTDGMRAMITHFRGDVSVVEPLDVTMTPITTTVDVNGYVNSTQQTVMIDVRRPEGTNLMTLALLYPNWAHKTNQPIAESYTIYTASVTTQLVPIDGHDFRGARANVERSSQTHE